MKIWQDYMARWSECVFSERNSEITPLIRVLRVLEEAIELAQAEGVHIEELNTIRDQVYSKPAGLPSQELGGVLVTLAGYASTTKYDLEIAFWEEALRIMDPAVMEKVRKRNLNGDKIGFRKN